MSCVELLVDGHVHIHPKTDVVRLLDAARINFSKHAKTPESRYVLLLTESEGSDEFSKLMPEVSTIPETLELGKWRVARTKELESLKLIHEDGETLFVIAGRQIVTKERLEVLAICTVAQFEDGLSICDAINGAKESGGVAVVPWGFGKWLGRRGKIVESIIENHSDPVVILGDNGGRLKRWRTPRLMEKGRRLGLPVLAGTDPLPFEREFHKVGRYGTRLECKFNEKFPAESVRKALLSNCMHEIYGEREKLWGFLINQGRMQVRMKVIRLSARLGWQARET